MEEPPSRSRPLAQRLLSTCQPSPNATDGTIQGDKSLKALGVIVVAMLVIFAVLTVANWSLFTAPATIDLLAVTVEGSLGLVLLGIVLVMAVLFALYALILRTTALVETRHHMKEMETQRHLADSAEASRFTGLREQIERQAAELRSSIEQSRAATLTGLKESEHAIATKLDETANALFAHIGQVDDKLNRIGQGTGTRL